MENTSTQSRFSKLFNDVQKVHPMLRNLLNIQEKRLIQYLQVEMNGYMRDIRFKLRLEQSEMSTACKNLKDANIITVSRVPGTNKKMITLLPSGIQRINQFSNNIIANS